MKPSNVFGSYSYEGKVKELIAYNQKELIELFGEIEKLRESHFCLGFVAYEAYKAFEYSSFASNFPLAYFGIFSTCTSFTPPKSEDIFSPLFPKWIGKQEYLQKVQELREQIKEGNTYQGNFITHFECDSTLSSSEIFLSLLSMQSTPYQALLHTPFGEVISFSPELFFSIKGERIITEPMKGTMPRGRSESEDRANKEFLQNDIKNRSENVMIVDLLRNDLNKIAQKASVKVPKLFEIHTYPTLFQMTSTISATLKESRLYEIFKALFPCGSISGAPKKSTLEILENLESRDRGVYCGALGVVERDKATFSIPIRTFFREKDCQRLHYGVGSGIVWDSVGESEYEELKTKMRFLSPSFELFESMLYENGKIPHLSRHLKRLKESSGALGFVYPASVESKLKSLKFEGKRMVKIRVKKNGEYHISHADFIPHASNRFILQERRGKSDLYAYKTTYRPWSEGIDYAQIFDVIFYDSEGRLSEGSRSNIILEIDGKLYTPRFEGQFLRGVMREVMLERKEIEEAELRVEDLHKASRIYCINSLRGKIEVNPI